MRRYSFSLKKNNFRIIDEEEIKLLLQANQCKFSVTEKYLLSNFSRNFIHNVTIRRKHLKILKETSWPLWGINILSQERYCPNIYVAFFLDSTAEWYKNWWWRREGRHRDSLQFMLAKRQTSQKLYTVPLSTVRSSVQHDMLNSIYIESKLISLEVTLCKEINSSITDFNIYRNKIQTTYLRVRHYFQCYASWNIPLNMYIST